MAEGQKRNKPVKSYPAIITPKAPAIYAWLNKKDQMSDKYTITVGVPKDDIPDGRVENGTKVLSGREWIKYVMAMAKEAGAPCKIGEDGFHIKDGDAKGKDDLKGLYLIEAKSSTQPKIIDTKGNRVPADVTVFGGDIVQVAIQPTHYRVNGKNYLTFYVNQVRLIEKNGRSAIAEWGDEEGYVAEPSSEPEFGSASDDENDGF